MGGELWFPQSNVPKNWEVSMQMYSDYDGSIVGSADELNYRTTTKCDGCEEVKEGTMLHAAGATGRVCAVLFLCDDCRGGEQ